MELDLSTVFEQVEHTPEDDNITPVTNNARTEARLIAVQGVYRFLLLADSAADIRNTFDNPYLKKRRAHKAHFRKILDAAISDAPRYREMLEPMLSENWQWERVGYVEKAILFCAVAELDVCQDIPMRVVLNEYLTIAHSYFPEGEVKFINGVLDKASKLLRDSA